MYYKILKTFGPEDGDRWSNYLKWRGLRLTKFDSVDGVLRADLFEPKSEEDWKNCVQEDFKISWITNLDYAKQIRERYEKAEIVGVDFPEDIRYQAQAGLAGYDLLDSHWTVSILTNWGTDAEGLFSRLIVENGLVGDLNQAFRIRDSLRKQFPEDHHVRDCHVCAVYKIEA